MREISYVPQAVLRRCTRHSWRWTRMNSVESDSARRVPPTWIFAAQSKRRVQGIAQKWPQRKTSPGATCCMSITSIVCQSLLATRRGRRISKDFYLWLRLSGLQTPKTTPNRISNHRPLCEKSHTCRKLFFDAVPVTRGGGPV